VFSFRDTVILGEVECGVGARVTIKGSCPGWGKLAQMGITDKNRSDTFKIAICAPLHKRIV